MRHLLSFILALLLTGAVYCAICIHEDSKAQVQLKEDQAEINQIKYGILSVKAWRDQVANILVKKIDEFDLSQNNRGQLKSTIEGALERMLKELDKLVEDGKKEKNILKRLANEGIGLAYDIKKEDLAKRIPDFAERVIEELEQPGTKKNLKRFIREKLDEFTALTAAKEDFSRRDNLIAKYKGSNVEEASANINARISILSKRLWSYCIALIALVILGLFAWLGLKTGRTQGAFLVLISLCIVPLWSGISTPMIDIDARISSFTFQLMGEPLSFDNQVLYFQSKSILDVVNILISRGRPDTVVVGLLVMLFSVIFPLLKILSTVSVEFRPGLIRNKLIKFFVLKSAKWSMADVLVVAIFMSYIGFKGVIDSQLGQLARQEKNLDILTTDATSLQVGFSLFLTFTLAGLFISSIAEKRLARSTEYIQSLRVEAQEDEDHGREIEE